MPLTSLSAHPCVVWLACLAHSSDNVALCDFLQIGGLLRQQQISEEEHLDVWNFKDDSNLCINDLFDTRQQTKTITQCDKSSALLPSSSQLNLNSPSVKRTRLESLSEGEVTVKLARKGWSHCFQGERDRNSHSENLSKTQMCNEYFCCSEDQRKSDLCLQGIEERESFLDDSWVKNKAASVASANSRSKFLSSMDDGKFDKKNISELIIITMMMMMSIMLCKNVNVVSFSTFC